MVQYLVLMGGCILISCIAMMAFQGHEAMQIAGAIIGGGAWGMFVSYMGR